MGKNSKALKLLSEKKEVKKKRRALTKKEEALEECIHIEEVRHGEETLLKALGNGIFKCRLCKTKIDMNPRSPKEVKNVLAEMLNYGQCLKLVNSKYMTNETAEMFAEWQITTKKIVEMYLEEIANRDKDYGEDDEDEDDSIFNNRNGSMSISTKGVGFNFEPEKKKKKHKNKRANIYDMINNKNNY